jgi:hypothetical protein
MDVVTPTPEDLAHGSKDLPDGFRIWDADGEGAVQIVAQYVELKESENTLVLKNREGLSFNMIFSALSEEDKEHARAMSQAAAEKPEGNELETAVVRRAFLTARGNAAGCCIRMKRKQNEKH